MRSRFKGPEESPGFLLWQVSTKWRREIESALVTLNLTHPQFVLLAGLSWLIRLKEEVTQVELARFCSTDVNMTSQVLRTLEQKGHIVRHQQKGDERAKVPKLTKQGAKLVEQALPLVEKVDEKYFGKNKHACITILQKLLDKNKVF